MENRKKSAFELTRRNLIGTTLAGGVMSGISACSQYEPPITPAPTSTFDAPPLAKSLLVNRERASKFMHLNKLDAIVCRRPDNIYYLTNFYPQLAKMGMENIAFAILPLALDQPPILVVGQYEFYIAGAESIPPNAVDVKLFTMPAEFEAFTKAPSLAAQLDAPGFPSFLPKQHPFHPLSTEETHKTRETKGLSAEMGATAQTSFLKSLRDMPHPHKRVAIDDMALRDVIQRADIDVSFANAEQILRHVRLQKSATEIELMRYAANANAQAGLAAAKTARAGASFQDIRREYNRQCVERFMTPDFMVVDGVIPENATGEIKDGRSFLIDCVSHGQYYHGDYGRTVCVGEPTGEIKRATAAIAQVWDDLLPQLKPGMRYSEIGAIATKIFKTTNSEAALICNPHSVGLHHTDEPSVEGSDFFVKDDLELLSGMIISVDLPVVDLGLGGSAHLEDLVLIGEDGASLLNDGGDRLIIV